MVPNLSKGTGIKGTALYVLHDKRTEEERALGTELTPEHQSHARVGFTATRNLSTDDPELAWRLMCATAANRDALKAAAGVHKGGRASKNQCGHLSLSWELETRPDAAEMERAAGGALQALGWDKLQALIVEHRDEEHGHCHIVVNLIDPETGRTAPNAKNDYEKLQRWAHDYDRARGIEACPNRAARMEPATEPPGPAAPAAPAKRWLSRKEYEAVQVAERAEHRAQAIDRYREAAADVREQFRPEWAELYRGQRAELRAFDKEARQLRAEIGRCRTGAARAAFHNEHRAEVWRGIDPTQPPGNAQTLLAPGYMRAALERGQQFERAELLERHGETKAALQERHDEARRDAYRQAWQRPTVGGVAQSTAYAPQARQEASNGRASAPATAQPTRDAQRDLDAAAERIARQRSSAANGNTPPPKVEEPGTKAGASTPADEVAEMRRRVEARVAAARQRERELNRDPLRHIGRERD